MKTNKIVCVFWMIFVGCYQIPSEGGGENRQSDMLDSKTDGGEKPQPDMLMMVKEHGAITVEANAFSKPTSIIVARDDVWQSLYEFSILASSIEDVIVERMNIRARGDAASFAEVAVAKDGLVRGRTVLPPGKDRDVDVDFSGNPIVVPAGGTVTIQLWAEIAKVVPGSSVGNIWNGVPRSGARISLGLSAGFTGGNWGAGFDGKFNVMAYGKFSQLQLYADGIAESVKNRFIVRKSVPTITRQLPASSLLQIGSDAELYKFQVSSDPEGPVALKKVTFEIASSVSEGRFLQLDNFKLRRNAQDLTVNEVHITDVDGNGYGGLGWGFTKTTPPRLLLITFMNEEMIEGAGTVYTLHARVGGNIVPGDALTIEFYRAGEAATGYLTMDKMGLSLAGPHLDLGLMPGGKTLESAFLWSDLSEVPHSASMGDAGGSRDWTDDGLIEDLTKMQALVR